MIASKPLSITSHQLAGPGAWVVLLRAFNFSLLPHTSHLQDFEVLLFLVVLASCESLMVGPAGQRESLPVSMTAESWPSMASGKA